MPEQNTSTESVEDGSDKELNFQRLKDQHATEKAAYEAELGELRPLRNKERLREAGFDPDSDQGKALGIAIKAGEVEADVEKIKEYASETFGWEPKPVMTETEQTQVDASTRVATARAATSSETPPDLDSEIAEAEAAGDWARAGVLKIQRMSAGV